MFPKIAYAPVKVHSASPPGIWKGFVWPYRGLWRQQYFPISFWHYKWYKYRSFWREFWQWKPMAGMRFWQTKLFSIRILGLAWTGVAGFTLTGAFLIRTSQYTWKYHLHTWWPIVFVIYFIINSHSQFTSGGICWRAFAFFTKIMGVNTTWGCITFLTNEFLKSKPNVGNLEIRYMIIVLHHRYSQTYIRPNI